MRVSLDRAHLIILFVLYLHIACSINNENLYVYILYCIKTFCLLFV